jgi:DNA-binding SARP family transcriptional activator
MTDSVTSTVPGLAIHTFGGLRLELAGVPLGGLGARTAEALLTYLAGQDRAVPREVLAEFLWPERPRETSLANLRVALCRLRKKVGPWLQVNHDSVTLQGSVWTDFRELERLLAGQRAEEALALYRGQFLAGFYLDASSEFENWLLIEQERFTHLAFTAWQDLLHAALRSGRPERALDCALNLLEVDPLHEPTELVVLQLLCQQGRRAAAVQRFERFSEQLRTEVGLPPGAAALALVEQIRNGG